MTGSPAPPAALQAPTLCAAFQATVAERGPAPALAAHGSDAVWSWDEYGHAVERFARGLAGLGVGPGDTVCFMLANRPEFALWDAAAMHLGATCCSIYNTSSVEQIVHVLHNAGPTVLVTERAHLPALLAARDAAGFRAPIISIDGRRNGEAVMTVGEVEALGRDDFDFAAAWRAVGPDDLLCLIYTSGTTGPPKGVELTHANMLSKIRGWAQVYPLTPGGRSISFLPHAHVADRWMNLYTSMAWGHTIYWVADAQQLFECSARVHPTVWGGVPRIWEKAKAHIEAALAALPDPAQREHSLTALAVGRELVAARRSGDEVPAELQLRWAAADAEVFAPLRRLLGLDQVEVFGTGAAPAPAHVVEFFEAIGIEIADMWGLSEACGNVAVTPPGAPKPGTVGRPLPGVEAKLADDGEILLRGPTVMRGYRGDPAATAEAIGADGWLRTGDLAEIDGDGYITIVGRKKELIINAAGKNMSPHNIESAIKAELPAIEHVVAIGDRRPYNVALIVLEPGTAGDDIRERVGEAVARANARLSRVEQIKRFHVVEEVWEAGGPTLTTTSKLRRGEIAERYADEIDRLYASASSP